MKVQLKITPVSGKPQTKEAEVERGSTLQAVLDKLNIGTKGFKFLVNGEPATPDTVLDGTVVVTATEKVAGS